MNWLVFALVAYLMLALEVGLRTLLALPGPDGVAPSFVLVLAIYIGLMAPGSAVPWAMLVLGLLTDLKPGTAPQITILGPAALGYLVGAAVVLHLRTLVFRESVITITALVFVTGVLIQLVIVGLYTARGLGWLTGQPLEGWNVADQLVHRFLMLLYTTLLAVPIGSLLLSTTPIWSFAARGRGERA